MTECAKRDFRLTTRVTRQEYDSVVNEALKFGISIADALRFRLNTTRIPEIVIPKNERVEHVK